MTVRSVLGALVATLALAPATLAQPLSPARAIALGDSLMAAFETAAAIEAYRRGLEARPDHGTLLLRAAQALSERAEETPGGDGDGPIHDEAGRLARRAVRAAPRSARAHATLAVVLGRQADWLAHERRITAAAKVASLGKEAYAHADRALELDPDDWVAHGFLGAMHRRLATVHPLVRQVARAFLRWPDVSLEKSEAHLVRSIRREPNEITTRIELARTYLEMGRRAEAERQVDAALAIEPKDRLDKLEQRRQARHLLP